MRKKLALILVIAMVLAVFAGCGSSGNGNGSGGGEESSAAVSFDPAQVKTMGDVFAAADEDNYQDLYTDTTYIYVFYVGDVCYRAVADMPADVRLLRGRCVLPRGGGHAGGRIGGCLGHRV